MPNLTEVAKMQTKEPYKTYRKTILGMVVVVGYNSFMETSEETVLKGNPLEEGSMFDVWSEMEDMFFRRSNMRHLKEGTIIEYSRNGPKEDVGVEQMSDDDIRKLVNSKFMALQNVLKDSTSETFLTRVRNIAVEEEKSEKILNHIDTRISEVQMQAAQA